MTLLAGCGNGTEGDNRETRSSIIPVKQKTASINLPGLSPEMLKTISIDEATINKSGQAIVKIPHGLYSFVYVTDTNDNIVGMYYGLPEQPTFNINIASTAKAVVMSIPIDWATYNLSISEVLARIETSLLYPMLKQQVEDIVTTDPANLISEQHPEIWETVIKIIKEIQSASDQNSYSKRMAAASLLDRPPPYIEDGEGAKVLIKSDRTVPYGISSMEYYSGNYREYFGIHKRPWWVPGKGWTDRLFDFGNDVEYELGTLRYITCVGKFPRDEFLRTTMVAMITAAGGGTGLVTLGPGLIAFVDLQNYLDSLPASELSVLDKVKRDAVVKGSVAWGLYGGLMAAGHIPAYGDIVSIIGKVILDLANSGDIDLLPLSIDVFKSRSVNKALIEQMDKIVETASTEGSYARVLAKYLYGDARMTAGIVKGASKLSKLLDVLGKVFLVGDIYEGTRFIGSTIFAEDIACYDISQDSSGRATINRFIEEYSRGTLQGYIKDAVTRSSLSGATVNIYNSNGSLVTSATTDSSGIYTTTLPAGTYYLTVTKTGYISETIYNITIQENVTTTVETVLQVSTAYSGTGTISGTIKNALDGTGVSGITINFRSGINTTTGNIVTTTATDSYGNYTVSGLDAGNYTGEGVKSGYTTAYFTVTVLGSQTNYNQDATITPILLAGETRIVLTWGYTPTDLDSHLTGPISGSSSRFHVYFRDKGSSTFSPYTELDVDDMMSYGPETITIYQQFDGVYRYSVHDYTNIDSSSSIALSNSGAQVKVYRGSNLVATFNVPVNQEGTLWTVFELSGDTITPINTMSYESTASSVQRRLYNSSSFRTDEELIRNLPLKW